MKTMTEYQRKLVEDNLRLVDYVIQHRIAVNGTALLSYEDYYQEGCAALCKAAMAYDPNKGAFSTIATHVIYNALIDHARKENRENGKRYTTQAEDEETAEVEIGMDDLGYSSIELGEALDTCFGKYTGIIQHGIEALKMKSLGFTTQEIADRYSTNTNNVNAWIARARDRLKHDEEFLALLA